MSRRDLGSGKPCEIQKKIIFSNHSVQPEVLADIDKAKKFFSDKVKKLRMSQGLSRRAFALKAEIDPSYVTLIERDGRIPTSTKVASIAKTLGVYPSELFPSVKNGLPDKRCIVLSQRLMKLSVRDFAAVVSLIDSLLSKNREKA